LSSGGRERRSRARVVVLGNLVGTIHTSYPASVVNLSETGALIEADSVLRPGTVHMLRLPLAGTEELTLRCRVVRSFVYGVERPGESTVQYRAALEFVALTDAERAGLRKQLGTDEAGQ
jgi:PilZ domain